MALAEIYPNEVHDSDIQPGVMDEAARLSGEGFTIVFEATKDPFACDAVEQQCVDREIASLEDRARLTKEAGQPTAGLLAEGRPAFSGWGPLTKSAVALHNIYLPEIETLGEGIDPAAYREALFASPEGDKLISAADLTLPDKLQKYLDFISTPIDPASRRIWQGSRDGAGVRTRALCAMGEVETYLLERGLDKPLVIASLACGAASPVYQLIAQLQSLNMPVGKAYLVDNDPMALATAHHLGKARVPEGVLDVRLESLIRKNREARKVEARDLTEFIEPKSVDVVDLLGLFEYFPQELAIDALRQVQKIMKPGGIIVLGNMIDDRPQQTFFTDVSMWPPLHQRSLRTLFEIAEAAGFDAKNQARILLPPQGVYAVMSLKMDQPNEPGQQAPRPAVAAILHAV